MKMEKVDNTVTGLVKMYLRDIGPLKVCNYNEELELVEGYNQGDTESFHRLVLSNQYIVIEEVLYFINLGIELVDLIQFANVALVESLQNFASLSDKKGLKSFLHRNIYRRLQNYIGNYFSIIRYPANRLQPLVNYNTEEIFKQLSYYALPIVFSLESKYSNANDDNEQNEYCLIPYLRLDDIEYIYKYLPSEENAEKDLLAEILKEGIDYHLNNLKENENIVLRKYFGLNEDHNFSKSVESSLQEIGNQLQLTRERVRQIKEKAISRLKHKSRKVELLFLWECCEKINDGSWYFPISSSRDLYFVDPFNGIVEDEKYAVKLLEEYVQPRRRRTYTQGIMNLSERIRKLAVRFLENQGKPCKINSLKKAIDEKFPLTSDAQFWYAINTCDEIIKNQGYFALKSFFN
jgi:RNA polymerase primary sigma factor